MVASSKTKAEENFTLVVWRIRLFLSCVSCVSSIRCFSPLASEFLENKTKQNLREWEREKQGYGMGQSECSVGSHGHRSLRSQTSLLALLVAQTSSCLWRCLCCHAYSTAQSRERFSLILLLFLFFFITEDIIIVAPIFIVDCSNCCCCCCCCQGLVKLLLHEFWILNETKVCFWEWHL